MSALAQFGSKLTAHAGKRMGSGWKLSVGVAAATLLGACAVGPDFVQPASPTVERYTRAPLPVATMVADGQAQRFTAGSDLTADWWRLFKAEPLDALVRQALADNPTLAAAQASLDAASTELAEQSPSAEGTFERRVA